MRMLTPYWKTGTLASDLFEEMDRLFDGIDRQPLSHFHDERSFAAPYEVSETESHLLLSFDLPGMKREDLKIEIADGTLTVSGERKRESSPDRKTHRHERSYGFFRRSLSLPEHVDADRVEARYQDGVLELVLPKTEAAKPRRIEIQSGKGSLFSKLLGSKKEESEMKEVGPNKAS